MKIRIVRGQSFNWLRSIWKIKSKIAYAKEIRSPENDQLNDYKNKFNYRMKQYLIY